MLGASVLIQKTFNLVQRSERELLPEEPSTESRGLSLSSLHYILGFWCLRNLELMLARPLGDEPVSNTGVQEIFLLRDHREKILQFHILIHNSQLVYFFLIL